MDNKVDKLFKDKLGDHVLPPSAQAWEKIESRLSKKNRSVLWIRIAAALALVGLLTFSLLQLNKDNQSKQPLTEQKQEIKSQPLNELRENELIVVEKKEKVVKQGKRQHKFPVPDQEQKPKVIEAVKEQLQNSVAQAEENSVKQEIIEKPVTVASNEKKKSIKLTYSLPSIKKEIEQTEQVAAVTEGKKTTLQKAVETARELRSGDVLGSIRDAKDELFALEFRKDKSKKQQ